MTTVIPENMVAEVPFWEPDLSAEEVERRFRELLGDFEEPSVPLNLRVTEEVELEGGVVRQRVEYDVDENESVPAYHLFKKNLPNDAPGMLSIHGHGAESIFPVGKAYHCHPSPSDPTQYSYVAALNGFRVLAPDALCFGERQAKWGYATNFYDEIVAQAELTSRGLSLAWKSVWDNSRGVEALEQLGATSVGAMGWSGGSTQAYILAAVNKKVAATACFFSFMTLRHQFYQYKCCHCLYHYIPGMLKAGIDWDQVVSMIPPRGIFLGWGALDDGSPEPMYRSFAEAIKRRAEAMESADSLRIHEEPEKGHEITTSMLENALEFLRTRSESM